MQIFKACVYLNTNYWQYGLIAIKSHLIYMMKLFLTERLVNDEAKKRRLSGKVMDCSFDRNSSRKSPLANDFNLSENWVKYASQFIASTCQGKSHEQESS